MIGTSKNHKHHSSGFNIGWLRSEHTKFNEIMLKTGIKVTITAQAYLTSIHFHHSAETNLQDLFSKILNLNHLGKSRIGGIAIIDIYKYTI